MKRKTKPLIKFIEDLHSFIVSDLLFRKDAFAPCTKCVLHLPDTEIGWRKKRFQLNKN